MIVIVGMAGAGKSTQCRRLAKEFGFQWIAVGDLLRSNQTGLAREKMMSGAILDNSLVTPLVAREFARLGDQPELLLDGCPRTLEQAEWLAAETNPSTRIVLHLRIDDSVALGRLLSRGREDDTADAMKRRFEGYHRDIGPVLNAFTSCGIPVIEVDANQDQDKVYKEITEKIITS